MDKQNMSRNEQAKMQDKNKAGGNSQAKNKQDKNKTSSENKSNACR